MSATSLTALRRSMSLLVASRHRLIKSACDPYRPELHYMRGPGPKWQAKHRNPISCALSA